MEFHPDPSSKQPGAVYTAIDICHRVYADCLLAGSGRILIPLASSQHNLYDIYLLLCIQYQAPDDEQKTCPKPVEFYSKNKFDKLVYLAGFIIRIIRTSGLSLILRSI